MDWCTIRSLNGARDKGFEELCSQLARSEHGDDARFIRKGNPDAGVECYAIFENGSECAWQAKYFPTLGNSQWRQIDESVRTALEKHPCLTRYVVCLPLDLPDARIPGQESGQAKWAARVKKWTGWASGHGMTVEFVYWGSSELLERLTEPKHAGRVRFWFDAAGFDDDWFARRLSEAKQTAGPRYTPELHVNLPIAARFEAFGRTFPYFDRTTKRIRDLTREWKSVWSPGPSRLGEEDDSDIEVWIKSVTNDPVVRTARESMGGAIEEIVGAGSAIEVQPSGTLPFSRIATRIAAAEVAVGRLVQHLLSRQEEHRVVSQYRHQFESFAGKLRKVREEVEEAQRWGGASLMIVRGHAGTGKTHLLCDVAHRRLAEGRPTVLLMGQSFTSGDAPWSQAANLLDESNRSAAEIVGALECAAQAAGARALVLIDALNEGKGLSVWPTHLSGFLEHFARSDWIGVVVSIRSSYDQLIPDSVRDKAVVATHDGLGDRSYDAMQTFFRHYGLELPSIPLIAQEFGNPLFLKSLCSGLQGQGATRLPPEINGITAIVGLYLSSINKRIAERLGLSPRSKEAETALRTLAEAFPGVSERWLSVEAAEDLVNEFLPDRTYEESLYRALVVEGVLVQEPARRFRAAEIVFIAYDRLADHLVTGTLLDAHFDPANPTAAFQPGAGLGEVVESGYETQGILEALCIQLPERTGREVADLVPILAQGEDFEFAFQQSLAWRNVESFSERTRELVRARLDIGSDHRSMILDALLALATTPGHPLNACFLDARLREDEMPERDTWWTVYLQHATSSGQAATRIRDWALTVPQTAPLDDDVVNLCATILAWMLTASNRLVRDRATKALVNLLASRLDAAVRLVEAFADVDDPYVVERIFAVAYGVAARNRNPAEVGPLAECVYSRVFATGAPPAHILLRDYARGVVERALYLDSPVDIDVARIRPPYASSPPVFPSDEEVAPLLPDPDHNPHRAEEEDWARSHIGHSVLEGELHRVMAEEQWGQSGEWLSLALDQPPWLAPDDPGSDAAVRVRWPLFDRRQTERYLLKRVFEFGWTTERFGKFDRTWDFDRIGRFAKKESIGRKYQWIAYHEVLALISDHFQYREYPADVERSHRYVGPWQNALRDIDPTLTATPPGGRRWNYRIDKADLWWVPAYDGWDDMDRLEDWVWRDDDLQGIETRLIVRNPRDGTRWINGSTDLRWVPKPPIGRHFGEFQHGEVLCWVTAFLTSGEDARIFVDWYNTQPFAYAKIMPPAEMYGAFVGEHGWAPAAGYLRAPLDFRRPADNAPVDFETVAAQYSYCAGSRDQSVSEDSSLYLPIQQILQLGRLQWQGRAADFVQPNGDLAAFDPSAHEKGPSALLVREDFLRELTLEHNLGVVWTVSCFKSLGLHSWGQTALDHRISGAFLLSESGPAGFLRPRLRHWIHKRLGS